MNNAETMTLLDFWPIFALAALAIFAIVVVFRGLRRRPDSSKNRSGGGGSTFPGHGG